ncbi:hypothetical protein FEM48_ZijujUnG0080300 [Ziziphus jujuba var. spinosa]|uniref:Plant methyltransferase dimerisation domain-containing protein n=1 Tax=Ziziphus jujuba var. spinosa TaxID=714518 RepID=A0A978U8P0_ZIZJJ|nr:hypothetical protein FEM48_ZijujUnG0080300 [Ziziphus jujuba var. spinosa]
MCMSLQCTIELGVFNIIGKAGPGAKLSPSDITAQMPTNNPEAPTMVDSILRVLACHSVLNCSVIAADDNIMALCKGYTVFLQCPNLCHKQRCLGVTRQNVTSTYPQIKSINFDLPHVSKHAPSCPRLAWHFTPSGCYKVRPRYWVAWRFGSASRIGSTSSKEISRRAL